MIDINRVYKSNYIKYNLTLNSHKIGRAYLYFIHNSIHQNPYGLIEDLYIQRKYRNKGFGKKLINLIIDDCKYNKCYKVIATSMRSRKLIHLFYKDLGFKPYGYEFRMNLK